MKWKSLSHVWRFATAWIIQSMKFSRPEYWPSGDLPNPGIEPRSPTLRADSSPAEPQGKPKNTGVGSLSLLQWIFPTQESNRGLLYCRWILYQLSYQGSPLFVRGRSKISNPTWKPAVPPKAVGLCQFHILLGKIMYYMSTPSVSQNTTKVF